MKCCSAIRSTAQPAHDVGRSCPIPDGPVPADRLVRTRQRLHECPDCGLFQVGPAAKKLPEIAAGLQDTLTHANKLLGSAETGYGDNSKFLRDTDRAILQLKDAAQSMRMLANILSRHPEALVRGRADTGRK